MADIPAEIVESLKTIDSGIAGDLTTALEPVAGELGPREVAVLQRLINGLAEDAPGAELTAFVRLLPVTVSRAVQPVIDPVVAGK